MLHIALFEPEIPPNTGNIIRLCANVGAALHLIHPLGFTPHNKQLKRAGLDYHEWANITHHIDFASFITSLDTHRLFAASTKGSTCYTKIEYMPRDVLIFGPESRGLPDSVLVHPKVEAVVRIPMLHTSRSLNLSNAVAIITYEALRQSGFNMLSLK